MAKNLTEKVALITSGSGSIGAATAGMPHGETSCVMLPHIPRYNMPVNAARQAVLEDLDACRANGTLSRRQG
jgi:alcohol dehydrogenase class IV